MSFCQKISFILYQENPYEFDYHLPPGKIDTYKLPPLIKYNAGDGSNISRRDKGRLVSSRTSSANKNRTSSNRMRSLVGSHKKYKNHRSFGYKPNVFSDSGYLGYSMRGEMNE